jgi:galactose mutarotase-like enzyme
VIKSAREADMAARIDAHWRYHDVRAIVLENARVRLTVLPDLGGKLYDFILKPADRNFLWHNPRLEPRLPVFGQNFDDWWCGGWDEVFPTCDVSTYGGETYPYLGELWSLPWSWQIEDAGPSRVSLALARTTVIAPARMEKRILLEGDEPVARFRHRLTNIGSLPMDFVWGMHPCFRIEPGYRIDAPAQTGVVGHTATGSFGPVGTEYRWPQPQLCQIPPASRGWCEGHYATGLREGWVALTDPGARVGVGLAFPPDVFPVLWCWMVYGGWRGHYHVALEPWTGWPHRLDRAVEANRHRTLQPGECLECETLAVGYSGLSSVSGIGMDGSVRS